MIIGLLLIAAAAGVLLWSAYSSLKAGNMSTEAYRSVSEAIEDSRAVNNADQAGLQFSTDEENVIPPDYVLNPDMEMPVRMIDGDEYIGVLEIPVLKLELPVMSEWTYPKLRKSPCRYSGTAYKGNFVILAHNYDRHFGRLKMLESGDTVSFTDMDGNRFDYIVAETEILRPYDEALMTEDKWDLTLFTCTIGGGSRVTVRCRRAEQ